MSEVYVAHDLVEFFAWLMAPQSTEDLRRVEIQIPGIEKVDLHPFLRCDHWNYSIQAVDKGELPDAWIMTLQLEDPIPDDEIETVQAVFDEAANKVIALMDAYE